jgi:hypothetical protein
LSVVSVKFRIKKMPEEAGAFAVEMRAGAEVAKGKFLWDPNQDTQEQSHVEAIALADCTLETLKYPGAALWARLFERDKEGSSVAALFEKQRDEAKKAGVSLHLRLALDPDLDFLPWEALYEEGAKRFAVLTRGFSIVREAEGAPSRRSAQISPARKLKVLVVIPQGSRLDINREWKNLQLAVGPVEEYVSLHRCDGRVHPTRLRSELQREEWDVVHFIGHGEASPEGVTIRLNTEDGQDAWIGAEPFSDLFNDTGVQLVVLNCCFGAVVGESVTGSLSGVGPFLLARGVPAVVAMRFEIPDHVATRFADAFYSELIRGRNRGRVDTAVHAAREAIYFNQKENDVRGFITPALFLAENSELLFEFADTPVAAPPPPPPPKPRIALPPALIKAFQLERCIPVIGPGILRAGLTRSVSPPVPDLLELSRFLAKEPKYPRQEDFDLCDTAGEWMDSQLFQWVCQNYIDGERKLRFELVDLINEAYSRSSAPSELTSLIAAIASWRVPAIFYTFFDGLLERAVSDYRDRPTRILPGIEQGPQERSERLLILVRGTRNEPKSLVITEDEHHRLWGSIGRMSSSIIELAKGFSGRSLLFLGLAPRDPLVRYLSAQLLDAEKRTQGRHFFACSTHTQVDDAFWKKFEVEWIDHPLELLIPALTEARG